MAMFNFIKMMSREDKGVLRRCSLFKALKTPQYTSDQRLLVDIVSHWDRRRHIFHLPQVGDMTVTPKDIQWILRVPATRRSITLGALLSNEAAHREATIFFTGMDRWERRGVPLQTIVMSRIPWVRKLITLCILFWVSQKQNYRDIPWGWMDAVHHCEANKRMD